MLEGTFEAHEPAQQRVVAAMRRFRLVAREELVECVLRISVGWRGSWNVEAGRAETLRPDRDEQGLGRPSAVFEIVDAREDQLVPRQPIELHVRIIRAGAPSARQCRMCGSPQYTWS